MFVSSRSWPISGGFSLVAPLCLVWSVALFNPLVMHHSLTWDDWPRSPILSLVESDFSYGILKARKGRVEYEKGSVGGEYVSESKRTFCCSGGNEEDDGFDAGSARCDALRERPGYASHGRLRRLTSVYRSSEPDIAVQLCHVCIRVWGSTGLILAPFGSQNFRSRLPISTRLHCL